MGVLVFLLFVAAACLYFFACWRSYKKGRYGPSMLPEKVHLVCDQCGCSFSAFLAPVFPSPGRCACCICDDALWAAENVEKAAGLKLPKWHARFLSDPNYDPEGQRINQQHPTLGGLLKLYKRDPKNMGAHGQFADWVSFDET